MAQVEIGGKHGFIARSGQLVVPVKFDEVRSFSDGLAWVRLGNEQGYIDKVGKFVWKAEVSR